ncbi:MAG: cyclase family protein [Christensenellales bacterium]|jgi:arylformamidase
MKIVDLSQVLQNGMPVFPGEKAPTFNVEGDTAAGDLYSVIRFTMTTHTGTHLDCPTHVCPDGLRTDGDDLTPFVGMGVVVDCRDFKEGDKIPTSVFQNMDLSRAEFVLLCCGWDQYWGTEKFFGDYPVLSDEAAEYLAGLEHLKGIGLEYISLDPLPDPKLALHQIVLGAGKRVIENLTNLDKLIGKEFLFCALPLKFYRGEGSPVRAVAVLEEK